MAFGNAGGDANQFDFDMQTQYLQWLNQQQQRNQITPQNIGLMSQMQGALSFPQLMSSGPGGIFGANGPFAQVNAGNQQAAVQNKASFAPVLQQIAANQSENGRTAALAELAKSFGNKSAMSDFSIRGNVGGQQQGIGDAMAADAKQKRNNRLRRHLDPTFSGEFA